MILHLMAWAPTREAFWAGMVANGFATLTENGHQVREDVSIDEIGPVDRRTFDGEGNPTGGSLIEGHHVNIRVGGAFAELVTEGMPTEGTIFERTKLLQIVPGLEWTPLPSEGVPSGYVGDNEVCLFDPDSVNSPYRVWA